MLADFQRELIVANTHDGLAAARARGRSGGRPRALTEQKARHARELYTDRSHTVAEIANLLGVSRTTLYAYLEPVPRGVRREHEASAAMRSHATRARSPSGVGGLSYRLSRGPSPLR